MPQDSKDKSKTICPECEKEVPITKEEGDFVGRCDNCGLDVGRILNKRRYDKALAKMNEAEQKESKGKKPSESTWW